MYAVIVGAGRIGTPLAKWLVSGGHEVSVIDEDRDACSSLNDRLGAVSVLGNSTNIGVLSKAGTNRADVLIATTRADDVNLVTCQLAKHGFDVPNTISVVNDQENLDLFDTLGVDARVNIADLAVARIQEGLTSRETLHLIPFSGASSTSLLAIKIPGDIGTDRRKLSDMSLPKDVLIPLVIKRGGAMSIPDGNTTIDYGDQVIVVVTPQDEEDVRDILTRRNGE